MGPEPPTTPDDNGDSGPQPLAGWYAIDVAGQLFGLFASRADAVWVAEVMGGGMAGVAVRAATDHDGPGLPPTPPPPFAMLRLAR